MTNGKSKIKFNYFSWVIASLDFRWNNIRFWYWRIWEIGEREGVERKAAARVGGSIAKGLGNNVRADETKIKVTRRSRIEKISIDWRIEENSVKEGESKKKVRGVTCRTRCKGSRCLSLGFQNASFWRKSLEEILKKRNYLSSLWLYRNLGWQGLIGRWE